MFHFPGASEKGGALHDLGPRADACRDPINIVFNVSDARWRPISNLALTNSILAANTGLDGKENCGGPSAITSNGHNVESGGSCVLAPVSAGDADPELDDVVLDLQLAGVDLFPSAVH